MLVIKKKNNQTSIVLFYILWQSLTVNIKSCQCTFIKKVVFIIKNGYFFFLGFIAFWPLFRLVAPSVSSWRQLLWKRFTTRVGCAFQWFNFTTYTDNITHRVLFIETFGLKRANKMSIYMPIDSFWLFTIPSRRSVIMSNRRVTIVPRPRHLQHRKIVNA